MKAFYRFPVVISSSAIDPNGHANNVEYVRWMQGAAVAHADASGCTALTRQVGATWVARSHHIEYLRPAYLDERLIVLTWIATQRKVVSLRKYLFVRTHDQVVLARGETNWVFIDIEHGKPKSIPDEVAACFEIVTPADEPRERDLVALALG